MNGPHRMGAVSRRGVIVGAGTALAATALGRIPAADAASPAAGHGVGPALEPAGSPLSTPLASAPISGYTYRFVDMYEFRPFAPTGQLTWGGSGTYSGGTASTMRASVDVPPGTLLRDVEWYVYNASASGAFTDVYLSAAGSGTIASVNASASIAPTGSNITATRVVVPSTYNGPYPPSSKLMVSIQTPSDGTVQVNGVRLGFSQGDGATGLLTPPVRVYDSRTGGRPKAGSTRTITVPATLIAPGTTGVVVNLTAIDSAAGGHLTLYPAGIARPSMPTLHFGKGATISNAATTPISHAGKLKVYTSADTHYALDLVGTIS